MVSSQSVSKAVQSLLISFALANFPDLVSADPPYYDCSANTIYGVSSLFQSNLENLLDSLLLKASVSHFNNTSIGNGSDRVTGAFLCLNYITDDRCILCISEAANNVKKFCPDMSEAVIWEEDCQMLYSNETLFGRLSTEGNIALNNKKNVSDLESEQLRFRSVVNDTLQNLTKQAAFNSSTGMYATKPVVFTDIDTLYAFVQCTPDLSPDNCSICLQTAITYVLAVYFSRGARLLSRSCYLRYEFYPFYEGATEPLAPFSPQSPGTRKDGRRKIGIIISVSVSWAVATLAFFVYYLAARSTKKKESTQHLFPEVQLPDICEPSDTGLYQFLGRKSLNCQEFPFIDLATIHEATNHFSESNKLGQGGFGPVYKGLLPDGKEVAVKRLSSDSDQGLEEFTNEVLLIMKLQHKNLVRLLGFCVDTEEKMLVYEYMPNSSLDVFLFDPRRRAQLDWRRRLNIIVGIARGILYLHEDSRLRIIHRDLKASNVLLDCDMNPKISDFGMARIIGGSEGEANTTTIVGTWGYMAPEYAMEGLYSVKSDVFSFGVLLLEIITGRRNAGPGFHLSKRAPSLLAFAWQLWNDGKGLELMDPLLAESCCPDEFLRCYHIGLLCIQEDAFDRPTMSSVVVMLKSKTVTLRQPERPAFSIGRFTDWDQRNACGNSVNGLTISSMGPR